LYPAATKNGCLFNALPVRDQDEDQGAPAVIA
jgi:hypothetical protein